MKSDRIEAQNITNSMMKQQNSDYQSAQPITSSIQTSIQTTGYVDQNTDEMQSIEQSDSARGRFMRFIDYCKPIIMKVVGCTAFFAVVYLIAWYTNGRYATHFDLNALLQFYAAVILKEQVQHGVDSIFNSTKGVPPTK